LLFLAEPVIPLKIENKDEANDEVDMVYITGVCYREG
jgi:hypothetical protein